MLKIKRIIFLFIIMLPLALPAQEVGSDPVDLRKVGKAIKKKRSPYYYPVLYQRYINLDTTLTSTDFRYLYYGYFFNDGYAPYGTPPLRDSLISYLEREDLMQAEIAVAARIAGDLLRESPFRLRETFIAAVSYEMAGKAALSRAYYLFFEKQVDAIMASGDGLSEETAFLVLYIPDEYEIIEVLGFQHTGQQVLTVNGYDMISLAPNPYGVEAFYFDVRKMLEKGFN